MYNAGQSGETANRVIEVVYLFTCNRMMSKARLFFKRPRSSERPTVTIPRCRGCGLYFQGLSAGLGKIVDMKGSLVGELGHMWVTRLRCRCKAAAAPHVYNT